MSIEWETALVTAAALTNARAKLKHTAFIELNREAVVGVCYGDGHYKRYKGFRVLGIDGSKRLLPDTENVIKEFGQMSYRSNKNLPEGKHAYGMASVMYDVLNQISVLGTARAYEVDLAMKPLE